MWQKILTVLGLLPAVAAGLASKKDSDRENGLETDGQASIAFVAGSKTVVPPDAAETQDERLARITDRALVWPGKPETIYCANQETMAFRYDLTVTDLPDTLYLRRPAVGGSWDPAGGVLLQPGEEASFEVVFVPPPAADKTRTRPFSYVLTRFDPRRSSDPGEIEADQPMRWVALPEPGDLKIAAEALHVVTRPWRRSALLQIQLRNKALLPSSVSLLITRAATKDALVKEPEDVDKIAQSVPDLTPGTWRCLLPPFAERSSYYATVTGTARVADREDYALSLPKPVYVQYVPWLRMARDWFLLAGGLLLMLWIVWGFPIYKTPKLLVKIEFDNPGQGSPLPSSAANDLVMTAQMKNNTGDLIKGQANGNGMTEINLPGRLCGFRWFGKHGWNDFCRAPQEYTLAVEPTDAAKADEEFSQYNPTGAYTRSPEQVQVTDLDNPFNDWVTRQTLVIPLQQAVKVDVFVKDAGWVATKNNPLVSITYTLDGTVLPPATSTLPPNSSTSFPERDLNVTDWKTHQLVVSASYKVSDSMTTPIMHTNAIEIRRRTLPYPIQLIFPRTEPVDPKLSAAKQQGQEAATAAAKAVASAKTVASQAEKLAGSNPAAKAQADIAQAAVLTATQASTAAKNASDAAAVATDPDAAEMQANNAANDQSDAETALTGAQNALAAVEQIAHGVPVHIKHPTTDTITPEDYLLLDQWDKARTGAQSNQDPAYQNAINAISYAMPFYMTRNAGDDTSDDLGSAKKEVADALRDGPSTEDKAYVCIANGYIALAANTPASFAEAEKDFAEAQTLAPERLLVKVAVAEGTGSPFGWINALDDIQNDPHLTKLDKDGILRQIKDIKVHAHRMK